MEAVALLCQGISVSNSVLSRGLRLTLCGISEVLTPPEPLPVIDVLLTLIASGRLALVSTGSEFSRGKPDTSFLLNHAALLLSLS